MSEIDNSTSDVLRPFEDLKRRVEITRDARFQANLRLERRHRHSTWMISILSLFVIFLSLLPNFADLSGPQSQILLALSVINSVFIIITSLQEASGGFQLKGDALHRSARKIATVFNKMMLLTESEQSDAEKVKSLQEEYQLALDDCSFNHENIDHFGAIAKKPSISKRYSGFALHPLVSGPRYFFWERSWMFLHIIVLIASVVVVLGFFFEPPN